MDKGQIFKDGDEYTVIYSSGWTTQCKTREEAESLVSETTDDATAPVRIYAGGTRYHAPAQVLRKSDGLVKTRCGQRGWVSEDPSSLVPCRKCH